MQVEFAFGTGQGGLLEASYWWEEYGEEKDGWRSCEVRERFGVDLLKAIRREWDMVDGNIVFSMGNERKVRFWQDKWCGDNPLCTSFPSLFAILLAKEAWVEDVWNHSREGVQDPRFSRQLNDQEVIDVECFFPRLQERRVCSDVEDQVVWTKSKEDKFIVKYLYKALNQKYKGIFLQSVIF